MTQLTTPRLRLLALSETQLVACQIDLDLLAAELDIVILPSMFNPVVWRAISAKVAKMRLAPPADHHWYTYWLIVRQDMNLGIGLAGFKGAPNGRGEVEIGYGLAPEQQNQGFMTEAAGALVDWALSHAACTTVTAWTEKDNAPSHRVLEKIGLIRDGQRQNQVHWRTHVPVIIR